MPAANLLRRWFILILAVSVVARVATALYLGNIVNAPPLLTDQASYHALAARIASGHGFSFDRPGYPFTLADAPTAFWSFLESLFIAGIYAIAGVQPLAARVAHAVLGGILLPWTVYRLSRRLSLSQSVSAERSQLGPDDNSLRDKGRSDVVPLVAAGLAAIYFYFVLYSATMMTETFYIVAVLWLLERGVAVRDRLDQRMYLDLALGLSLGASCGIAILMRQSILPWVAVLFVWLLFAGHHYGNMRRVIVILVVATATLALMILPFTIRNYRAYNQFLLLNSNAGYAMYSAQHPMHGTSFQEFEAAPLPGDLIGKGLNEAQFDRELMRRGIGFVLADPGPYLRPSISRVPDYFEFWPTRDTSLLNNVGRVGSFGLFLPFMLYGIYLAARHSFFVAARSAGDRQAEFLNWLVSPVALMFLFMSFYSVMHIFTWAMPRYRLPVDAVALPFAALALVTIAEGVLGAFRARRATDQVAAGQHQV